MTFNIKPTTPSQYPANKVALKPEELNKQEKNNITVLEGETLIELPGDKVGIEDKQGKLTSIITIKRAGKKDSPDALNPSSPDYYYDSISQWRAHGSDGTGEITRYALSAKNRPFSNGGARYDSTTNIPERDEEGNINSPKLKYPEDAKNLDTFGAHYFGGDHFQNPFSTAVPD